MRLNHNSAIEMTPLVPSLVTDLAVSGALRLMPWLLGKPLVEHRAREADMSAYSLARQPAAAHCLVDPARLDVQIPRGLLRAKSRSSFSVVAGCCSVVGPCIRPYRPPTPPTGQQICPRNDHAYGSRSCPLPPRPRHRSRTSANRLARVAQPLTIATINAKSASIGFSPYAAMTTIRRPSGMTPSG